MPARALLSLSLLRPPPRSTLFPYTNALPIFGGDDEAAAQVVLVQVPDGERRVVEGARRHQAGALHGLADLGVLLDRKSTRLNSSHVEISYAVFCLKKKKQALT